MNYKINLSGVETELLDGINEIKGLLNLEDNSDGIYLKTQKTSGGISIVRNADGCEIKYGGKVEFFRALSILIERFDELFSIEEKAKFSKLTAMVDNSRNAVMNIHSLKKLIRIMAIMGYTGLMLYTEDVYEVEGEPYFGYMRGKYTENEIKELDSYAQNFGIELIPCIQTLAHLNSLLKWPHYQDIKDNSDILLIGEEKTYQLIDKMFASAAKMYSSRNIHIGMDEAEMMGLGNYLKLHGCKDRLDIFIEHLNRVVEICKKYEFKPAIWSDMLFQIQFGTYYNITDSINSEIMERVPKELKFIYWDYYNSDIKHYENLIDQHLKLGREISFAGGAWKWVGFAPYNKWSLDTSKPALQACIKKGIKEVMVTLWGDNGNECSCFSVLPALALYSEQCYGDDLSDDRLAKRLKVCANCDFYDFMKLDIINELYDDKSELKVNNSSKYLLYNDPLNGMMDYHVISGKFNNYYKLYKYILSDCSKRSTGEWKYIFETLIELCNVLEIKCDFGVRLKMAYDKKDLRSLEAIRDHEIKDLIKRINKFHTVFRKQWNNDNKTVGFDVQDIRIGGLIMRIKALKIVLSDYLIGKTDKIEELEIERLSYTGTKIDDENINLIHNFWNTNCTPNNI